MILSNKGILGINARNLLYIRPYNPKKAIRLADDKIKTKQFLSARDIPVPKLYGIIKDIEELNKFDFYNLQNSFVLKPNHGYGGEGIIPVTGRQNKDFTFGDKLYAKDDLVEHISDILDGRFSISNIGDQAFFEQYIIADERIGKYSYAGLPDIRIVVHNLIPVMAMLRLPTKESNGKANLHMGAVGIGIDIAKGETTYICYKNGIIENLPDDLGNIKGVKIPYWDDLLLISSKVQLLTNLGYMAVDLSIDKNTGPILLEINARAGLSVQIANLAPLRKRLERIEGLNVTTPSKGVRIAKDMFGNVVESKIANLFGKEVLNIEEEVKIIQKNGILKLMAKIDTSKDRSIIDAETAGKTGLLEDTSSYDDEKSTLKLKFSLKNKRVQTIVDVEKIPGTKYQVIIGIRDLKDFLISADNKKENIKNINQTQKKYTEPSKINFYEIDQALSGIDGKIKLLYHLRPLNLHEEKDKFFKNENYNPQFEYPSLKFDPLELIYELSKIKVDDSPLGKIFEKKKEEISNKIELLEVIDETNFSDISIKLFGKPEEKDIEICLKHLKSLEIKENKNTNYIDIESAKRMFEETFKKYNLKNWKVKIKDNLVADCIAGKNNSLFVNSQGHFTAERIKSLIIHEIETHILTTENGKAQNYEIFKYGLANYLITQEGLAIYNVVNQTKTPFEKNTRIMANVLAIDEALKSSFISTFHKLLSYNLSKEQSFRSTLKAKRGFSDTSQPGAFTKDYVYLKGYFEIKNFIDNGGNIKDLYTGKFNIHDLETIKELNDIKKPRLLPQWISK